MPRRSLRFDSRAHPGPNFILSPEGDWIFDFETAERRRTLDDNDQATINFDAALQRWALDELLTVSTGPMVQAIAVDGKRPTPAQVQGFDRELRKAPAPFIRAWRGLGGRVEVVPGNDASIHPEWRHGGDPIGGWHSEQLHNLICVAGEQAQITVLHELGHFVDRGRRFSDSADWRKLHKCEPAIAKMGPYYVSQEAESFAQAVACIYHSKATRSALSGLVQRFITQSVATI